MSSSTSSQALTRPRAAAATVDDVRLRVTLEDGREIVVPLAWFDWLERASDSERRGFRIIGGGAGLWWDLLDDGISVPGLFGLPERP
jgi:hypothetical protein